MNEIQITAMLAEAIANKGAMNDENVENELNRKRNLVEMTEKQRIRCLLLI